MRRITLISAAVTLMTVGLVACGGSDDDRSPVVTVPVGDTLALTASGKIVSFNRATPATLVGSVGVRGLGDGESLVGIDVRPADAQVYGVSNTGRVYVIAPSTGAATLKSTLAADATDTTAPFTALTGTSFGVDFNPVADRLRVVSNTGLNLRINVDTGATTTDGTLALAGGTPAVSAAAYTNSFAGTSSTRLYDLDVAAGLLHLQDPPNNGTLAVGLPLGVTANAANGFDIDPRTNTAYAALTIGGVTSLYTINLSTGAATVVAGGAIAGGEAIAGLALTQPSGPTAIGLTADNQLLAFDPATPNTISASTAITGLVAGENVVGIDVRPVNGMLYALTSAGRVYTVNVGTGAATAPVALANDTTALGASGQSFAMLSGTRVSVDFNPVADRLRVVSETGLNLRINVDTGATLRDGDINRMPAASVVAAAYTNSGVTTVRPTATALYDMETNSDVLALQSANPGTLTDIGALGVDAGGAAGFDIGGGDNGLVLAALRPSGTTGPMSLYAVSLATGAATPFRALTAAASQIGGAAGVPLIDLAIRN